MKISKLVSVIVFAGLAAAAATAAADSSAPPVPPKLSCKGGTLTASSTPGWRVNGAAPWKWDQAAKATATFKNCDKDNHCDSATIVGGTSCSGTVTAFVCSGDTCSPPMKLPVH